MCSLKVGDWGFWPYVELTACVTIRVPLSLLGPFCTPLHLRGRKGKAAPTSGRLTTGVPTEVPGRRGLMGTLHNLPFGVAGLGT